MRGLFAASLLAILSGCTPGSAPAGSLPTSSAAPADATTPPVASASRDAAPESATRGVFAIACSTECADSLARLTVYRDGERRIGVVTVQGSPAGCSDPPLRFLGPDGKERAVIPLVPVVPGSPEQKRYAGIAAAQTANLHQAETMLCRDVKH